MLDEDPDDKRLLFRRATTLQDGPDGLAYEAAARESIRWFPREPTAYWELGNWYGLQEREDLSRQLYQQAAKMLPKEFDVQSYTKQTDGDSSGSETPRASDSSTKELPTEKDALLDLIWNTDDSRRAKALAHVLEMESRGNLLWHERARVLSCRLLIPDDPEPSSVNPEELLPDQVPSAPHWFVGAVCDLLTSISLRSRLPMPLEIGSSSKSLTIKSILTYGFKKS